MTALTDASVRCALARADALRLSATLFTPESAGAARWDHTVALANDVAAALRAAAHPLADHAARCAADCAQAWRSALAHEYGTLFVTEVLVNPYEGGYQEQERGPVLGDIAAFYAAFGLTPIDGSGPPDSMWNELSFASWMAVREAHAAAHDLGPQLETVRAASATFLEQHLGRWVGAFCSRVVAASGHAVFASATHLLLCSVSHSLDVLGVERVLPLSGAAALRAEPELPSAC